MNRVPKIRRLCSVIVLATLGAAGCGYTVGPTYRPDIRTVHVPVFQSESFRRGFDLQLTEAVQKQIQETTSFRLAKEPGADTRLVGRIIEISKRVDNQNRYDDPRELELDLAVEVRWEDAHNGQLIASQQFAIAPAAAHAISQMSFAPEAGQSMATATKDAIDLLARQIVQFMEAPW